jgi:hypothetical protein
MIVAPLSEQLTEALASVQGATDAMKHNPLFRSPQFNSPYQGPFHQSVVMGLWISQPMIRREYNAITMVKYIQPSPVFK